MIISNDLGARLISTLHYLNQIKSTSMKSLMNYFKPDLGFSIREHITKEAATVNSNSNVLVQFSGNTGLRMQDKM